MHSAALSRAANWKGRSYRQLLNSRIVHPASALLFRTKLPHPSPKAGERMGHPRGAAIAIQNNYPTSAQKRGGTWGTRASSFIRAGGNKHPMALRFADLLFEAIQAGNEHGSSVE